MLMSADASSLGRASVDAAEEKFVTEEKERTNEIRVDVDDDVFTRGETKGGGSFDSRSVLQNVHFGTMVKTRLLSLSLCFSYHLKSTFRPSFNDVLFATLTSARDTSLHFVSDLPDLDFPERSGKKRAVVFFSLHRSYKL